jgi:phosphopantothenate-cysteine ligase
MVKNHPDIIILAAAVSDYGIDNYVDGKIRSKDTMSINLKPLPKIISKIKEWSPNSKLVGFKLLVDSTDEELIDNAKKSIIVNHCDMVVANDLRDIKNNAHRLIIVKSNDVKIYSSIEDKNYLARVVVNESMKL